MAGRGWWATSPTWTRVPRAEDQGIDEGPGIKGNDRKMVALILSRFHKVFVSFFMRGI